MYLQPSITTQRVINKKVNASKTNVDIGFNPRSLRLRGRKAVTSHLWEHKIASTTRIRAQDGNY